MPRLRAQAALALAALALTVQAAADAPVAVSTGAAAARRQIPLFLTFVQERGGARRLELGYSLRWDLEDIKAVGPGFMRALRDPAGAWRDQSWDVRDRTGFVIYGVRVNPWKALFQTEPAAGFSSSTGTAAGAGGPKARRRRFRPDLRPMIKDINDHIDEDIQRAVLRESLRRLPAEAQNKTIEDQRELLRDLVRWQREGDIPGLSLAADGLDYLAPQKPRRARLHDVRLSTGAPRGRPAAK